MVVTQQLNTPNEVGTSRDLKTLVRGVSKFLKREFSSQAENIASRLPEDQQELRQNFTVISARLLELEDTLRPLTDPKITEDDLKEALRKLADSTPAENLLRFDAPSVSNLGRRLLEVRGFRKDGERFLKLFSTLADIQKFYSKDYSELDDKTALEKFDLNLAKLSSILESELAQQGLDRIKKHETYAKNAHAHSAEIAENVADDLDAAMQIKEDYEENKAKYIGREQEVKAAYSNATILSISPKSSKNTAQYAETLSGYSQAITDLQELKAPSSISTSRKKEAQQFREKIELLKESAGGNYNPASKLIAKILAFEPALSVVPKPTIVERLKSAYTQVSNFLKRLLPERTQTNGEQPSHIAEERNEAFEEASFSQSLPVAEPAKARGFANGPIQLNGSVALNAPQESATAVATAVADPPQQHSDNDADFGEEEESETVVALPDLDEEELEQEVASLSPEDRAKWLVQTKDQVFNTTVEIEYQKVQRKLRAAEEEIEAIEITSTQSYSNRLKSRKLLEAIPLLGDAEINSQAKIVMDSQKQLEVMEEQIVFGIRNELQGSTLEITEDLKKQASSVIAAGLPTYEDFDKYIAFSELQRKSVGNLLLPGAADQTVSQSYIDAQKAKEDKLGRLYKRFKNSSGGEVILRSDGKMLVQHGDIKLVIKDLKNGRVHVASYHKGEALENKTGKIAGYLAEKLVARVLAGKGVGKLKKVSSESPTDSFVYIPPPDIEQRLEKSQSIT